MKAYRFGRTEQTREITIERFGGVDFSTHPTKVDLSHSPDACNLIAEETHFLVKRPGYKRLRQLPDRIFGLFALPGEPGAMLVHSGSRLLYIASDGTETELANDMAQDFSAAFVMKGGLYLLDGVHYRVIRREKEKEEEKAEKEEEKAEKAAGPESGEQEKEKWTAKKAADAAYVPTTTIAAPPGGGGEPLEAVNLLTPKRINTFIGNGSATQFYLDAKEIDEGEITVMVDDKPAAVQAIDRKTGVVTLKNAPSNGSGLPNVTITFCKTVKGNADKINHCRIAGLYGGKNDTRVFVSGNPAEPNCDWQSGLYDPTYFPDTGYTRIGSDAGAIVGYVRQYDSQIIIKEGGAREATQYLRSFLIDGQGKPAYAVRQGAEGVGAVAPRSFAVLGDVPMFLSPDGVAGVFGTAVNEQRTIRQQSAAVAPRLVSEPALRQACAIVWQNRYYLATGGNCYVADGRFYGQDAQPEWYFWNHFPADCFAVIGDRLCFGTADGRVLRLCESGEEDAYFDDGEAIDAWWRTPALPLGGWSGHAMVHDVIPVLMPYTRSGATVSYESSDGEIVMTSRNLDLFSFHTFDFSRISFRCQASASPMRLHRRLHRAKTFQVRVRNDRAGEPFGLLALTICYHGSGRVL